MVELLPKMQKKIKKACKRLRNLSYVVDEDAVYDFAMDYLIKRIRRIGDGDLPAERLKVLFDYLLNKAVRNEVRKRKRNKEYQTGETDPDAKKVLVGDPSAVAVETVLMECDYLPKDQMELLLKVVHKRDDERTLRDIFCESQRQRWWTEVRPALKKWAVKSGLTEEGYD